MTSFLHPGSSKTAYMYPSSLHLPQTANCYKTPMPGFIGDQSERIDVASLRLPTEQIEFGLRPETSPASRQVLLNGPLLSP